MVLHKILRSRKCNFRVDLSQSCPMERSGEGERDEQRTDGTRCVGEVRGDMRLQSANHLWEELSGALKYPVFQRKRQGERKHPGGTTLKPGKK